MNGTITNIQKYCVHDGPGIRTTVFFKGCPLKCWWCHNPETQKKKKEIMFYKDRCSKCMRCINNCAVNALHIQEENIKTDYDKCIFCGKCSEVCLNDARENVGKDISSDELVKELLKDNVFYEQSNGGITISGGEPMFQFDFLKEVLEKCRKYGLHTAIETSGYAKWEEFEKILEYVDLFLYDVKLMDRDKHKKYIGVDNKIILDNLRKLSENKAEIIIRMPIIKGINDNYNHIDKTINMISNLNIIEVNLLPYHKMGMNKYKRLDLQYKMNGDEIPIQDKMNNFASKFIHNNIKVKIGL